MTRNLQHHLPPAKVDANDGCARFFRSYGTCEIGYAGRKASFGSRDFTSRVIAAGGSQTGWRLSAGNSDRAAMDGGVCRVLFAPQPACKRSWVEECLRIVVLPPSALVW